ncbi:MAG: phosphoenolpyruvate--protein phosphotransferase, partial [Alphaproteobacteria bacterium]|nr:phosphoenolpyruvate--protein phosphotransferase [Alphaproteobacteria bacterium]
MKTSEAKQSRERVLDGLAAAPGIAIGTAHRHEHGQLHVPEYRIPAGRLEEELERFSHAARLAARQVDDLLNKARRLPSAAAEEMGYLLEAYLQMLKGSRLVRGVAARIKSERINAESAVMREIGEIVEGLAAVDDSYLAARAADISEVGSRLIRALNKSAWRPFEQLNKNSAVLADELSPADTALLDPKLVVGLATEAGGMESHTAIMARSLGIPSVLGVQGLLEGVKGTETVIIDGGLGRVIIDPSPETLAKYRSLKARYINSRRQLAGLASLPAITRDGETISLLANLELPSEVESVLSAGAEGVGRLRSEFLFMNRTSLPGEGEQYQALAQFVRALKGRPVTIRTLDAGSEKLPGLDSVGLNPALGLRAIRLSLKHPELMEAQLAACLRAGAHGPIRILLPMVMNSSEVIAVREMMTKIAKRLKRRRIPIADPLPPLGVMIEIPGAAVTADALAAQSDFFAIGTNDLTMYTLAIDRSDEAVANLYNPLHPAVLRLIQFSTEAALRARIPVSVCGEMAGEARLTGLLLGLGIRELSMAPIHLGSVKQRIRAMSLSAAIRRTRNIMDQVDSASISGLIDG